MGEERAGRGLKRCGIRFEGRKCASWEASSSVRCLEGVLFVFNLFVLCLLARIAPRGWCAPMVIYNQDIFTDVPAFFTGLQLVNKTQLNEIRRRIRDPHPNITAHQCLQLDWRSFQARGYFGTVPGFVHVGRFSAESG